MPQPAPQPEAEMQAAFDQAAPAKPVKEAEPDYQLLYEQECQRLKALEDQFRAERETWKQQRPAQQAQQAMNNADVAQLMAALLMERHLQAIAQAHPDWREIAASQDLAAWIDSHPGYLATSLRQVVDTGEAEEVIDLLTRFKQARATAGQAVAPAITPEDARRVLREMSAAAVPSRPAGPPAERPDENDFMAAWNSAVNTGN